MIALERKLKSGDQLEFNLGVNAEGNAVSRAHLDIKGMKDNGFDYLIFETTAKGTSVSTEKVRTFHLPCIKTHADCGEIADLIGLLLGFKIKPVEISRQHITFELS